MEIMCSAPLARHSEFFVDDHGVRLFGTCGPTAFASAAASALGTEVSPLGVYNTMLRHRWCDPGGASVIGGIVNVAGAYHIPVAEVHWFQMGWGSAISWLRAQALAGRPTVIEVARGQQLVDAVSGLGENAANLQFHYIAILGYNSGGVSRQFGGRTVPAGFWCADGDSFAGHNDYAHGFNAQNVLQFYPEHILADAWPCAAVALQARAPGVPSAMTWKETPTGGIDDEKHTCGSGLMKFLGQIGKLDVDGLDNEIHLLDGTTFLGLKDGTILTDDHGRHSDADGAQMLLKVYDLYQKAASGAPPSSDPFEPKYTRLKTDVAAVLAKD